MRTHIIQRQAGTRTKFGLVHFGLRSISVLIPFLLVVVGTAWGPMGYLSDGRGVSLAVEDPKEDSLSLDQIANEQLQPLDLDNRYDIFVRKDELGDLAKDLAWSKGGFKIIPYGYIWANTGYNSATGIPGDYVLYADSKDNSDVPDYFVDARQTRLGLFIEAPKMDSLPDYTVRGCVEIDFEGTINVSRNKGGLQLRKAFVEMVNKKQDIRWAFGQDWEVISPLYPQMLSYLPAGFAGNIGYRRAQFRVEKGTTFSSNFKTLVQLALADDLIGDYTAATGTAARGQTSGVPLVEGRLALSFFEQARCGLPLTLGISGHYGQDSYKFLATSGFNRTVSDYRGIKTWSANVDMDFPITERLRLQGEYYLGENLSTFCGGINQGIDLYRRAGIRDSGGWLSLHTKVNDKLCNNTGYAIDVPLKGDLIGTSLAVNGITSARTQSSVLFTNFLYNWTPFLMTGAEVAWYSTNYQRADIRGEQPVFLPMEAGNLARIDLAVKYSF